MPVKTPLRKANFPDALKQLVKVIAAATLFQPVIIKRETLYNILAQPLRRPNAKLRAPMRLHAVADRDDCFQPVVIYLIGFSIGGSCCKICNN